MNNNRKQEILMKNEIQISTEYITLGQFLKLTDIISSGGMAKMFIEDNNILVNDELEKRRGRKLYPQDHIMVPSYGTFIVKA